MDLLPLIGILVIIIGFYFKFNTIAVVLISALITALVSGISFIEFLDLMGQAFVDNRLVTLFLLTLPMIGVAERYGLRQQAIKLLEKIKGMTAGRLISIYLFARELAGLLSIRVQGHTQFIRPLIEPMAQAAATAKYGDIDHSDRERIKARAAAHENIGNFFAQNTFVAAGGVLLITGTMESLGYSISATSVALASLPIAVIALIMGIISNLYFDRSLDKKYGTQTKVKKGVRTNGKSN